MASTLGWPGGGGRRGGGDGVACAHVQVIELAGTHRFQSVAAVEVSIERGAERPVSLWLWYSRRGY